MTAATGTRCRSCDRPTPHGGAYCSLRCRERARRRPPALPDAPPCADAWCRWCGAAVDGAAPFCCEDCWHEYQADVAREGRVAQARRSA